LRTTCSDTLPRNSRPTAPRPWLPTRTMSTRSASAAETIWSRPHEERHVDAHLAAALDEGLGQLLAAVTHLVHPGAEASARHQERARIDDGDDEQLRAQPGREVERLFRGGGGRLTEIGGQEELQTG
jgi:hypothetical protein